MKYTVLIQEVASKRIKELFLKILYDYKDPINASNYIGGNSNDSDDIDVIDLDKQEE